MKNEKDFVKVSSYREKPAYWDKKKRIYKDPIVCLSREIIPPPEKKMWFNVV